MKWKYVFIFDAIYLIQFTLFLDWYYPRTIMFSGYNPITALLDVFAVLEMIFFYLLLTYNATKLFKE